MYVRKSAPAIWPALPVPVSLLSVLAAFKVNAPRRPAGTGRLLRVITRTYSSRRDDAVTETSSCYVTLATLRSGDVHLPHRRGGRLGAGPARGAVHDVHPRPDAGRGGLHPRLDRRTGPAGGRRVLPRRPGPGAAGHRYRTGRPRAPLRAGARP